MKQKINFRMIAISLLAILATMLCLTYIYYEMFQRQIRNDLNIEARLLAEMGVSGLVTNTAIIEEDEIRITWISAEGEVLFDNDVSPEALGNHMNRPEVEDAFKNGYGESVRDSDTMNLRTFYVALLLEDGTVIRVATDAISRGTVFISTFPIVFVIIVVIMGLCILISHYLTIQLLRPIGSMAENIDNISDVSAYKELSPFLDRIREQHEDILHASRVRQEFTANVSHELKTPITAISGYAELIENRMVDEEQGVKFAGYIRKNADRLVTLINDIIRLSELDQSGIPLDFSKLDLYEIACERVELLQNQASQKQIRLILNGDSCEVTANKGMMVELLDNLIQNAIRYNVSHGSITVKIKKSGQKCMLTVEDTGIGIPKADQERIFERFYRVDKSRSRETGGTGLGLAIVKHIVELHEGKIEVESELGKGSTFRIEF